MNGSVLWMAADVGRDRQNLTELAPPCARMCSGRENEGETRGRGMHVGSRCAHR